MRVGEKIEYLDRAKRRSGCAGQRGKGQGETGGTRNIQPGEKKGSSIEKRVQVGGGKKREGNVEIKPRKVAHLLTSIREKKG